MSSYQLSLSCPCHVVRVHTDPPSASNACLCNSVADLSLTNGSGFGSGFGSGSCYFHHWPSRRQPKNNVENFFLFLQQLLFHVVTHHQLLVHDMTPHQLLDHVMNQHQLLVHVITHQLLVMAHHQLLVHVMTLHQLLVHDMTPISS
jgi:hypothetical protein